MSLHYQCTHYPLIFPVEPGTQQAPTNVTHTL